MSIRVEVMYSDLSIQKESLDDIDKLPKDNVLFILITTTEEVGKLKNIDACFGQDNYVFCQKRNLGSDWIMLFGWDDGDFVWRKTTDPHVGCNYKDVVDVPFGFMHVIFRGVQVTSAVWEEAKEIFNRDMA